MVAGTTSSEHVFHVEAKRVWNAALKDTHNLFPKALPEIFSSVTLLEGNGGVGTIKQLNFTPVNKQLYSYIKERVDEIDDEKLVYKYTVIEGGTLEKQMSAVSYEINFVAREEGGCVLIRTVHYDTLPDAEFDEGKVKALQEKIVEKMNTWFGKIDQYLLSNPNLYC